MASLTRSTARGMAHNWAKKAGFQKINKSMRTAHPITGLPVLIPSALATHWRSWFGEALKLKKTADGAIH